MDKMPANERREAIFNALCLRRHDTIENLAFEFNVSVRTIKYDIERLTLDYPIETVRGRHGGGVKIADDYRKNGNACNKEEAALLLECAANLEGQQLEVMKGLLRKLGIKDERITA